MINCTKPALVALASGAILLAGFACQTVQAAPLDETGSSYLSDAFGSGSGSSESLTVSWSVVEDLSGIYTYTYTIDNPAGDVLLNNDGSPTTTPEVVFNYSVGFDTTAPGAYVLGSISGGAFDLNNGVDGLTWNFTAVSAGNNSPALSFESDLPPTMGDADALGDNPPSPWSSYPNGQEVPVPEPVPDSMNTLALLAGMLLLLRFRPALLRFIPVE
jgi:hypothetical protein